MAPQPTPNQMAAYSELQDDFRYWEAADAEMDRASDGPDEW